LLIRQFPERDHAHGGATDARTSGAASAQVSATNAAPAHAAPAHAAPAHAAPAHADQHSHVPYGVVVRFIGANAVNPVSEGSSHAAINYLLGPIEQHRPQVPLYEHINYKNLYDGVDLHYRYSSDNGGLKSEFTVAPGAKPENIKLKYEGAQNLTIAGGKLVISTPLGELIESAPYVYQLTTSGDTTVVESHYKVKRNKVSFEFPNGYNESLPLVIDPELAYSTLTGSIENNWGTTAAPGPDGSMFLGGIFFEPSLPVNFVPGAQQIGSAGGPSVGGTDIALMKFNEDGDLAYATILGGSNGSELPQSIVATPTGELFVLGVTSSSNFPTSSNAIQRSFAGGTPFSALSINFNIGSDFFISKIGTTGRSLSASTFWGGSGNDAINLVFPFFYGDEFRGDIELEPSGNVYVVGSSASPSLPGISQVAGSGAQQVAVVAQMSSDLSNVLNATQISADNSAGYSLDFEGNTVAITGTEENQNGDGTIMFAFLNRNLNLQEIGTLNSNSFGRGYLVEVTAEDELILLASTPQVVNGNPQQFYRYRSLQGVQQFIDFGSGQNKYDFVPTALNVNSCGQISFAGFGGSFSTGQPTSTIGLPTTTGSFDRTTDGGDFYIGILRPDGILSYGTFFGGTAGNAEHVDGGTSRFDDDGTIHQAICSCPRTTAETNFPLTSNAYARRVRSGNCNMAIFKFALEALEARFEPRNPVTGQVERSGCAPYTTIFANRSVGAAEAIWDFGDGTSSTSTGSVQHTYSQPGTYTVTLTIANPDICQPPSTFTDQVVVSEADLQGPSGTTRICEGEQVQLNASGGTSYSWSPAVGLSSTSAANPIASPTSTTTYRVTVRNGACSEQFTTTIFVSPQVNIDFDVSVEREACEPLSRVILTNNSTGATSGRYRISLGNGTIITTSASQVSLPYTTAGDYQITVSGSNQSCQGSESENISVTADPDADFADNIRLPENPVLCNGESIELTVSGGASYTWSPVESLSATTGATVTSTATETTEYAVAIDNGSGCVIDTSFVLTVVPNVVADFTATIEDDPCLPLNTVRVENRSDGAGEYCFDLGNGSQFCSSETNFILPYTAGGTFELSLTVTNGACTETATQQIEVKAYPDANFAENIEVDTYQVVCTGDSYQLQASGGTTYLWSPATYLSDPTSPTPRVTPEADITYNLRIFNSGGCFVDTAVVVDAYEVPNAVFEVNTIGTCTLLPKVQITNKSEGLLRYTFDLGDGRTVTTDEPVFEVEYAQAGIYPIKLTVGNGFCEDEQIVNFDLQPDSTALFGQNVTAPVSGTYCSPNPFLYEVTATGGSRYEWFPANLFTDPTAATTFISYDNVDTRSGGVRVFNQNGCVEERTFTLQIEVESGARYTATVESECRALLVLKISDFNTETEFGRATIDVGDGTIYNRRTVGPSFTHRYSSPGQYLLTVRSGEGSAACDFVTTQLIDISPDSIFQALQQVEAQASYQICEGESVQLSASGADNYIWNNAETLDDRFSATPIATPTETTTYRVTVIGSSDIEACSISRNVQVVVVPNVVPIFAAELVEQCDELPALRLSDSSTGATSTSYSINGAPPVSFQQEEVVLDVAEGEYQITFFAENQQCSATVVETVTVEYDSTALFAQNVVAPQSRTICRGDVISLAASGAASYEWAPAVGLNSTNGNSIVASPTETTTYTLTARNEKGCPASFSFTLNVVEAIEINYTLTEQYNCGGLSTYVLTNTTTGADAVVLRNGAAPSSALGDSAIVTFAEAGLQYITIEAVNAGCAETEEIEVNVPRVLPPNLITPNDDGRNDTFDVGIVSEGWRMEVYNRWDKLIYSADNYDNSWPGATPGVYFYQLISPDGNVSCKGYVTVLDQ
jgi:gliding motility-associated-like protein